MMSDKTPGKKSNDGIAGSNYGWPTTEGATSNPSFRSPLFFYGHGSTSTTGCAIAGGTFYNPTTVSSRALLANISSLIFVLDGFGF